MISKNNVYAFSQAVLPPVVFTAFKKSPLYSVAKSMLGGMHATKPTWMPITGGSLAGRELFVTNTADWQREMLSGTYDSFFFDYLQKLDVVGKTILEIGAHIGYHSLAFAAMVGPTGKVVAFEPNPFNAAYMKEMLERNPDLAGRIHLLDVALSSENGTDEFLFSDKIDEGTSSGSFIDSADTIWEKQVYETHTGFKRMKVTTSRLDSLEGIIDGTIRPDIMKIDVEGAEGLVLEGAKETIEKYAPLLLIEVHSIYNMYEVLTFLTGLGYTSTILKKETDGRCFLACKK